MVRTPFQALAEELKEQAGILGGFSKSRLPKARNGSIFVGAGDSYAAAMAGFYLSGGKCVALDPYSLASTPEIAEGVEVFLISVSGRTSSNIAAAMRVRGVAKKITLISANEESQLAKLSDDVVKLPMDYVPRTPGMVSFTLSLLAVMKMTGGGGECDFRALYASARKEKGKLGWGKGTTYFLGNSLGYPAALYAAAKTYEFLGFRAHPELLEEFSHMQLFSLTKSDVVNVFSCFDPSGVARKLNSALGEQGYRAREVPSRGESAIERLFHAVFVTQISVMEKAEEMRLGKPRFLSVRGRLRVSDGMIY